MDGQWIGPYGGTNNGLLIIELDDVGPNYLGTVVALNANTALPAVWGELNVPKTNGNKYSFRINPLKPIERTTGAFYSQEDFSKLYPGAVAPNFADTEWQIGSPEVLIKWTTDVGTHGEAHVKKSEGSNPSNLKAIDYNWVEFKEYATKLEPYRFLFRGQENNAWKLRTSFHRTGRASLFRFMTQDLSALHRNLSGLTQHRFNLNDPLDYAAFLALVQHHGYPTPLLDWTHSPFIAAYFAYRSLDTRKVAANQRVRIHVLDGKTWNTRYERSKVISPAFLHMTILEPLAINNPRVVPQQSASLVTNVDDLEKYIQGNETSAGMSFLTAIDLPVGERSTVIRELDLMGINAGSLFPGLDGACHQLKERFFGQ